MPRFQKGVSGNPRGRPPGGTSLAERIREKCGADGQRYVDELDRMAMNRRVSPKTRLEIMRLLLERGFGKPPTDITVSTGAALDLTGLDLSTFTDAQVQELYDVSARAAAILAEVEDDPVH